MGRKWNRESAGREPRDDFPKKVIFEQRFQGSEEVSPEMDTGQASLKLWDILVNM